MKELFACTSTGSEGGFSWRVRVPERSPFFEGHFPGTPILPAVAELALIEDLARAALGPDCSIRAIPAMRFRSPVGPGEELELELGSTESAGARAATLRRGSEIVARGTIVFY